MRPRHVLRHAGGGLLVLVAAVFIWAGTAKALDPGRFAESLDAWGIIPWLGVVAVALYLPWLELVAGVALLLPRWRGSAALVIGVLLGIFALVLAFGLWRGMAVDCGCFGADGTGLAWPLGRDLALLAALLGGLRATREDA